MEIQDIGIYLMAAGFGTVAGMRSLVAPALVSHKLARHLGRTPRGTVERALSTPAASRTLKWLAAGELFFDKLPRVPDRTAPPSLMGRAVSGALAGAACASYRERPSATSALVGALGAVAAAHGMLRLRRLGSRYLSEPFPGLLEDALALGIGVGLLWRL